MSYVLFSSPSLSSPYSVHNFQAIGQQHSYPGFEQVVGTRGNPIVGPYGPYSGVNSVMAPNLQVPMPLTQHAATPTLFGKG